MIHVVQMVAVIRNVLMYLVRKNHPKNLFLKLEMIVLLYILNNFQVLLRANARQVSNLLGLKL